MKPAALALLAAALLTAAPLGLPAAAAAPAGGRAARLSCAIFMDNFVKAAAGHRASFERPLNITRGFLGEEAGLDIHVLSTGEDVEGTLKCREDAFQRFEVRIGLPASDKVVAAFGEFEQAALAAAFGWDRAKVQTIVNAMSADAAEYLRASVQRGDTYLSGKVEYHQGDALDLGLIWTPEDRMLIVTTQNPS